ncbi:MAG: ATP-dependent DNA ligase [Thalassobius sp.]|nr:ATP-dependent DNA ligase [Thalassovita sp.]
MRRFATLFSELDQTNKTNKKISLLKEYFLNAPDKDKLWVLAFFTHKRPKRQLKTSLLRSWVTEIAHIPDWLFSESYNIVGDLAETISLVLPEPKHKSNKSLTEWVSFLKSLGDLDEEKQKQEVIQALDELEPQERFILVKLLSGGFRIGVSQNLIVRAVSEATGVDKAVIAHRIMGNWHPDEITFNELIIEESPDQDISRPYPFCLAHPISDEVEDLGDESDWFAEWKWDGIRGQIIVRNNQLFIWSRGEELVTDKFPEFETFNIDIPDGTVLDGEILSYENGVPLSFGELQTRIGRKNITKSILKKTPVAFMAYDILEWENKDLRNTLFEERRQILENLNSKISHKSFVISPLVKFSSWNELKEIRSLSREHFAEGLMLKRKSSVYHVGRKRGDWWKWKIDPLSVDGVLIYAQKGHGRRAGLYTDYTFGVWDEGELIVFAKAYSGLTDAEIRQVDAFIRRNTQERFGPVRTVTPKLVFEIGFEGIRQSKRHKSGVALRFPRILRWRKDKTIEQADTLASLNDLVEKYTTP